MAASSIQQLYTLGRGELYFARYAPGTTQHNGNFRYLGNSPEFNLTVEEEKLDHFSSDRGIREKDLSVSLEVTRTATLTLDSIDLENLSLFFFGSSSQIAVPALTAEITTASVSGSGFVQLGQSDTNPLGYRNVTGVDVDGYDVGDDYTVEADLGLLYIVPGGAIALAAAADPSGTVEIEVTFDVSAHSYSRVISGGTAIEGELKYISRNPTGPQRDYVMPRVTVGPNGDLALKGDDWQTMPFSLEVLKKPGLEAVYVSGRPALIP